MSKFIQHPFDFQIRSAIRREACAVNKSCDITALGEVAARINYILEGDFNTTDGTLHLIAFPDVLLESGDIDVTLAILEAFNAQGTSGYNPGITAETDLQIGIPQGVFASLVATPDTMFEGGSFPVELAEETLMSFSAQGSGGYNSGITAEPEVTVI